MRGEERGGVAATQDSVCKGNQNMIPKIEVGWGPQDICWLNPNFNSYIHFFWKCEYVANIRRNQFKSTWLK